MIYNLDDYPVFDGLPVLIFCCHNVVILLFFNIRALLEKKNATKYENDSICE